MSVLLPAPLAQVPVPAGGERVDAQRRRSLRCGRKGARLERRGCKGKLMGSAAVLVLLVLCN